MSAAMVSEDLQPDEAIDRSVDLLLRALTYQPSALHRPDEPERAM